MAGSLVTGQGIQVFRGPPEVLVPPEGQVDEKDRTGPPLCPRKVQGATSIKEHRSKVGLRKNRGKATSAGVKAASHGPPEPPMRQDGQ